MTDLKKVIYSIERCICHVPDACRDCAYDAGHPYNECVELLLKDALALLKAQEEAKEEVSGTLDKLIKETQDLLSKAPTDFDIVKGIIERSGLRKHFDEATIETGERIITLRHGADEVDLLFDKDGRIE